MHSRDLSRMAGDESGPRSSNTVPLIRRSFSTYFIQLVRLCVFFFNSIFKNVKSSYQTVNCCLSTNTWLSAKSGSDPKVARIHGCWVTAATSRQTLNFALFPSHLSGEGSLLHSFTCSIWNKKLISIVCNFFNTTA